MSRLLRAAFAIASAVVLVQSAVSAAQVTIARSYSCVSSAPGFGTVESSDPYYMWGYVWGPTPSSGGWDASYDATCTDDLGATFDGAVEFNQYPYSTPRPISWTSCGTATGRGTFVLRLKRITRGSIYTADFPIVVPITATWGGYDQEFSGNNGTNGGKPGGSVTGDTQWAGTCPGNYFQVAGSAQVTP